MNCSPFRRALLGWLAITTLASANPIVASYERFQDERKVKNLHAGRLLLEELNCVACHQADGLDLAPKRAPILTEISGRAKASQLIKFIADPQGTKPGTTMPSLLHGVSTEVRDRQAKALVHFLYSMGPGEPTQAYATFGGKRRGEELFQSVGCVVCHSPRDKELLGSQPIGNVQEKYTLPGLSQFLQNPLHVRPSGRMPSLNLTSREATDIASYLLPNVPERPGIEYAYYEVIQINRLPDFDSMTPKKTGNAENFQPGKQAQRRDQFALQYQGELVIDTPGRYQFHLGSDDGSRLWIDDKVVVDNDGVHGMNWKSSVVDLDAGRHSVVIDFFEAGGGEELEVEYEGPGIKRGSLAHAMVAAAPRESLEELDFEVDAQLAADGQALFGSLGCAACHEVGREIRSSSSARSLVRLDATNGCLSDSPRSVPDYHLRESQRTTLRKAINNGVPELNPKQRVRHAMLRFNCVACHQRDQFGGVEQSRIAYFKTTQAEMGVEGSIPPHLDQAGAKLTRAWLQEILAQGAKDRPYMLTRMPKFGTENVGHLAELLEQLDTVEALEPITLQRKQAKKVGHRLVGSRGFSCIKCHTFGRHRATGVQSIDMTIMTKRLREEWFRNYVRNPQIYRRGTRMPSAWPETGPSLIPELLDGESEKQIAAVWTYLNDGIRAKTPAGLATNSNELVPTDEAIIYRNFIEGAGTRAIGVGYPEGIHIAFDANDLRLALIWQGAFIDASRHWNGRGQGFQPPAGEKVRQLVAGVSVAKLQSPNANWPAEGGRELGHRFRGYRLTSDQRPTFLYVIDGLQVEDFIAPIETETNTSLGRSLTIVGATSENTFLRLASGSIQKSGDAFELGDGLRLSVQTDGQPMIREVSGTKELLVPLDDTKNERTINLEYHW